MALLSKRTTIKDAMGPSGGLSDKDPEQGSRSWGLSKAAGMGSQEEGGQGRPVGVRLHPSQLARQQQHVPLTRCPRCPHQQVGGVPLSHLYR